MKNLVTTLCLVVLFVAKSFAQDATVYGTIGIGLTHKYAYLYEQETKTLMATPITDRKFSFRVPKPDTLKIMTLYFSTDLVKTREELIRNPNYDSRNGAKLFALEDTVEVTVLETARYAIVKAGSLNKDIDDMFLAIKSKTYLAFFEQHPDSPIAIVFLKTLPNFNFNGSPIFTLEQCKSFYDKLSDRLKSSDEGKRLLAMISK